MAKVKFFRADTLARLEKEINEWIEESGASVQSVSLVPYMSETAAVVLYG